MHGSRVLKKKKAGDEFLPEIEGDGVSHLSSAWNSSTGASSSAAYSTSLSASSSSSAAASAKSFSHSTSSSSAAPVVSSAPAAPTKLASPAVSAGAVLGVTKVDSLENEYEEAKANLNALLEVLQKEDLKSLKQEILENKLTEMQQALSQALYRADRARCFLMTEIMRKTPACFNDRNFETLDEISQLQLLLFQKQYFFLERMGSDEKTSYRLEKSLNDFTKRMDMLIAHIIWGLKQKNNKLIVQLAKTRSSDFLNRFKEVKLNIEKLMPLAKTMIIKHQCSSKFYFFSLVPPDQFLSRLKEFIEDREKFVSCHLSEVVSSATVVSDFRFAMCSLAELEDTIAAVFTTLDASIKFPPIASAAVSSVAEKKEKKIKANRRFVEYLHWDVLGFFYKKPRLVFMDWLVMMELISLSD